MSNDDSNAKQEPERTDTGTQMVNCATYKPVSVNASSFLVTCELTWNQLL